MKSLSGFLEKMGGNFIVAAIIPSLAFVTSAMFVFEPIFPPGLVRRLGGTFNPIGESGLLALIIAVVLGFTLTSLNMFILKVFEGYILFWRIPAFRKAEMKRFLKDRMRLKRVERRISYLKKMQNPSAKVKEALDSLIEKKFDLEMEFQNQFPSNINSVLPFRFGNILKAAETYPVLRYKIDSVTIWTRLIQVIPSGYNEKIDQTHNQLSFLVNCAVLSLFFGGLSFMASLYQAGVAVWVTYGNISPLYFLPLNLSPAIYFQRSLIYVALIVGACLMMSIFIRASLLSVSEFGYMIKSSYDLFRFDLIKQLHLELPADSEDELDLWLRVSNFMRVGYAFERQQKLKPFLFKHDYRSPDVNQIVSSSEVPSGKEQE